MKTAFTNKLGADEIRGILAAIQFGIFLTHALDKILKPELYKGLFYLLLCTGV
jgi:hypothetical protein